jgi:hypothetical protein
VDNLEIEKFRVRLKKYNFKFDDDILCKNLEIYDSETVSEVFEDIINNSPRLTGLNIIFELKAGLQSKRKQEKDKIYITEKCDICGSSGFVSLHNAENYSFAFLCSCSTGEKKKEYNPKLRVWNGEREQFINGKKFVLDDCYSCRMDF